MSNPFTDIAATLLAAKKEKSMGKSVAWLALAAVLLAVSTAVLSFAGLSNVTRGVGVLPVPGLAGLTGAVATASATVSVVVFLVVLLGGLFIGWVYGLVLKSLGAKGGAWEGITALGVSLVPISLGVLLSELLGLIPFVGALLSFIVFSAFGAIGFAALYRATKELFTTDMITAFVAVTVLSAVVGAAVVLSLGAALFGALAV